MTPPERKAEDPRDRFPSAQFTPGNCCSASRAEHPVPVDAEAPLRPPQESQSPIELRRVLRAIRGMQPGSASEAIDRSSIGDWDSWAGAGFRINRDGCSPGSRTAFLE